MAIRQSNAFSARGARVREAIGACSAPELPRVYSWLCLVATEHYMEYNNIGRREHQYLSVQSCLSSKNRSVVELISEFRRTSLIDPINTLYQSTKEVCLVFSQQCGWKSPRVMGISWVGIVFDIDSRCFQSVFHETCIIT